MQSNSCKRVVTWDGDVGADWHDADPAPKGMRPIALAGPAITVVGDHVTLGLADREVHRASTVSAVYQEVESNHGC